MENEIKKQIIENIAEFYDVTNDFDYFNTKLAALIIVPQCKDKNVLEVGCANGVMTEELIKVSKQIAIVEPSLKYCDIIKNKIDANIKIYNYFLEDIKEKMQFDVIVLASLLHHVENPQEFLKVVRNFLKKDGIILATVPNMQSLHRRLGVKSGFLKDEYDSSERNETFQQLGRFDKQSFEELFKQCSFDIVESFGYMLKPFSSEQMMQLKLEWNVINAFFELGKENQHLASQLYIKAKFKDEKKNIKKISFSDLSLQYEEIKVEIDDIINSVIKEKAFVRGKYVKAFENNYSEKYGIKHCVSCANGTDAIYLALRALEIGHGDEVITTSLSWIATSEVITQSGAKVVFVDIEPEYFTIDPKRIEEKITDKTKAIIPVHIYGQSCNMDEIMKICRKYDLYCIEDCAQAHFSEYKGKKVGTIGDVGTFSFYPSKNLGAYGDAGCVITNNEEISVKVRMIANHGSLKKHEHEIEGINSRMDGIQAAILNVKLKYIDKWTLQRQEAAYKYNELLKDLKQICLPKIRSNSTHVFHLYVIRSEKRNELKDYLKQNGIDTNIHYPSALPFLKSYNYLKHKSEDFPVVYEYQKKILSLPMFPELKIAEIEYIAENLKRRS